MSLLTAPSAAFTVLVAALGLQNLHVDDRSAVAFLRDVDDRDALSVSQMEAEAGDLRCLRCDNVWLERDLERLDILW